MRNFSKLNIVGYIIVGISMYFISEEIWENKKSLDNITIDLADLFLFLLLTFSYGFSQLLLSSSWIKILKLSGETVKDSSQCFSIYGKTQIAKYLPGNIFHFAGRQILGQRAGYSQNALAAASVYESLILIIVAGLISVLGSAFLGVDSNRAQLGYLVIILVLSVMLVIFGITIYPKYFKSSLANYQNYDGKVIIVLLKKVVTLYCAFFVISGLTLALVVSSHIGFLDVNSVITIVIVGVFSWLIGFVTPGSPAGIGVREAVIISLVSAMFSSSVAIFSAFMYRIITVLGDIIFYFISYLIGKYGVTGK